MMAFTAVAAHGSANIGALAPGVSGALLTTVVGLVVAIPSLIGYNLLTVTIRKITVYMDNFTEEFIAKVKLEQLENER
jgi:biopolymer transport protein TolQ